MKRLHRNLSVLEAGDASAMREILLALQEAGLVAHRISDRFAAVDPGQIQDVMKILKDLGHLPKVMN